MERTPPSRARLWLVVGPLIVLTVAAWVGDALVTQLVDRHPLLLMTLNARNRNLVLVTNLVDTVPYYVVGTVRLLASDPLFYILGYWYGETAVAWVERRSTTFGEFLRSWEWLFTKAAYPLVAIAPNNIICLFAGSAGMRPGVFLVLNVAGTIGRLYLIRRLGEAFEAPINDILGFIKDYRLPLTVLAVALVVFTIWRERRAGATEIEALAHIDEEMAEVAEEEGLEEGRPWVPQEADEPDR
jgi:membrane protein DedA with SNARE-associated domain